MALVPSIAVREAWTTTADAAAWAGVQPELWKAVAKELGSEQLESLLLVAGVSDEDYRAATSRVTPPITALQKSALNLMFNGIKAALGVPTMIMQSLASPPSSSTGETTVAVTGPGGTAASAVALVANQVPKIKLSQVIDQGKEMEVPLLEAEAINEYRAVYSVLYGDNPMESCEVTDAQLTALHYLITNGLPPYADFGVWGPYGTRVERRMRFKSRVLDSSGQWTQHEAPGPDCIESWRKCWKVFVVAATMLKVASGATLAKYETQFEERSERYHKSWHLCVQADVRCRSEWVTAERRRQEAFHVKHPHVSSFNPRMPWDTILREAADSQAFWYKELLEPALLYERSSGAVAIPAHRVYDHDVAVHDDTFALGSKRKRGNRAKVEARARTRTGPPSSVTSGTEMPQDAGILARKEGFTAVKDVVHLGSGASNVDVG